MKAKIVQVLPPVVNLHHCMQSTSSTIRNTFNIYLRSFKLGFQTVQFITFCWSRIWKFRDHDGCIWGLITLLGIYDSKPAESTGPYHQMNKITYIDFYVSTLKSLFLCNTFTSFSVWHCCFPHSHFIAILHVTYNLAGTQRWIEIIVLMEGGWWTTFLLKSHRTDLITLFLKRHLEEVSAGGMHGTQSHSG